MASSRFVGSMFMGSAAYLFQRNKNQQTTCDPDTIEPRKAICILNSTPGVVMGTVLFEQADANSSTSIHGKFTGLTPGQLHGFHIHNWGNLSNGCVTAGPHYNPYKVTHAGPEDSSRHVGDLGNVQADAEGNGLYERIDREVKLFGPLSVIGRACVLHKDVDDLGKGGHELSLTTGNAGARIACGVIGMANY